MPIRHLSLTENKIWATPKLVKCVKKVEKETGSMRMLKKVFWLWTADFSSKQEQQS